MEFLQKFFLACVLVVMSLPVMGQYDINIDIANYENDTLIVGYYYANKQLVRDTLYADSPGQFNLQGSDTLETGIYILLSAPDNEYVQFHVNDDNKSFDIAYDYKDKTNVTFKGSEDNTNFQNYINMLGELRPEAQTLRENIDTLEKAGKDVSKLSDRLKEIDESVAKHQLDLLEKYPNSITARILRGNQEIKVPEFADAEDVQMTRYRYYKAHYFDNLDLGDPVSMNIGLIQNKLDVYMDKLTSNYPDSIISSLDFLLEKMEPSEETYKYYLSTYLSKYGKSKVIGYDAIYVHLVDNYYAKGKAPWTSEENLVKIIDNAKKISPALIGKIGDDIKVYKEDGKTPVSISDIDYEYLVLLFWAPDCGHCTKMMPKFVEFGDKWKDSGVKIFAICTKHQDKTKTCWDKLEEKNMLGFINAADEYHRSRFKLKYNVTTTPKVFILNKDREILLKNLGAEQLENAMLEILKTDKREDLIPQE